MTAPETIGETETTAPAAHQLDETVMDDLDYLLARRDALQDVLSDRPFSHVLREFLHHLEVDIRLQKGHSDVFQGLTDVLLVQSAASLEPLETWSSLSVRSFEHNVKP